VTTTLPDSGELVIVHACPGLQAVVRALAGDEQTQQQEHVPHTLEYLNLTNNLIDPAGARVVADFLAGHGARAGDYGVHAEDALASEQAYDDNGELIDSGSPTSSAAVVRPVQLRTLLLDSNPLGDDGLCALAASLRTNTSVTSLSLRGHAESSTVGVRGFEELAHALSRYNRTVEALDIGNNAALFAGRDEGVPEVEEEEQEEEEQDEDDDAVAAATSPRSKRAAPMKSSVDRRASQALASLLYHATNGVNESGTNLLSLRLDHTGINDGVLVDLAPSLAANHSLRRLDLSGNPLLGEKGVDLLFQALARQGVLASLRLTGTVLGDRAVMRLADWLRRTEALEELHVGVLTRQTATTSAPATDEWGQLTTEAEADLLDESGSASAEAGQQHRAGADELSELAVSTLAGALTVARGRRLARLALGDMSSQLGSVIEQLTVPVQAPESQVDEQPEDEEEQLDENGEPIPRSLVANGVAATSLQLVSLDLGGNLWTNDSLSLLSDAVRAHHGLVELRLSHSELDASLDVESGFEALLASVLANPSLTLVDLSGTPIGVAGLEGIGAALLGSEGAGVAGTALQSLDLSFCGLDEFGSVVGDEQYAAEEEAAVPVALRGSKFLQALSQDACTLTSVSLRGNDFPAGELLRLVTALENNWNLRTLNLADIIVRQGEESLTVLRQIIAHAVQHGLGSLSLPSVRQPTAGAGAGVQAQRDALISAVGEGWRSGVANASAFLRDQGRTPESVLHQLRLDLGVSLRQGAPLTWAQKQKLLESIRPLNQSSTSGKPAEESFRLVQLTAGGVPLRLNTQQHGVCGVDLIENALAARFACQRL